MDNHKRESYREDKQYYLKELCRGKIFFPQMLDIALVYFHSGIPLEEAKEYMRHISTKFLKSSRVRFMIRTRG